MRICIACKKDLTNEIFCLISSYSRLKIPAEKIHEQGLCVECDKKELVLAHSFTKQLEENQIQTIKAKAIVEYQKQLSEKLGFKILKLLNLI